MSFDTTDPDTIRAAMAAAFQKIVPRYLPQQDSRFTWTKDQEVDGGGTLRTFDAVFGAEVDSPLEWHSGGIMLVSRCEIRVSYPVSEPAVQRFVGADGQDLAGILVRLHKDVDGLWPVNMRQEVPIFAGQDINGQTGAYVCIFSLDVHFFASDQVQVA